MPGQPSGLLTLCQSADTSIYTCTASNGSASYIWEISPAGAGTISGTGTTGTVIWDDSFSGNASISVRGQNSCGFGMPAKALVIITSSPAPPVITQNGNTLHSDAQVEINGTIKTD